MTQDEKLKALFFSKGIEPSFLNNYHCYFLIGVDRELQLQRGRAVYLLEDIGTDYLEVELTSCVEDIVRPSCEEIQMLIMDNPRCKALIEDYKTYMDRMFCE